jgi:flagellar hook-associated protein 1 FlgK
MLGLFGALNLGARSLQTQQQAVEIAGQNLANVNNPAYSRQRVLLQTSPTVGTSIGPQGTGVGAVAIQQIRDALLDRQITGETSVSGYWTAQQTALQYGQNSLGEQLSASATISATGSGASPGLASALNDLFGAFQTLSAGADATSRLDLISKAQDLAGQFNQTSQALTSLRGTLNDSVSADVDSANSLLADIAKLNSQIGTVESAGGSANDLRDLRQEKLESLAKLVNIDTSVGPSGAVNVSIAGNLMVSGPQALDTLQTYDAGGGQMLVRSATSGAAMTLTGGTLAGTIDARDGALATLQDDLNSLAAQLVSEVNAVHRAGFSNSGTTGADFFTGTDAATIHVNASLVGDPSLLQTSSVGGLAGDNKVALSLAQLADKKVAGLGNLTFSESYSQIVAQTGQSLATANDQVSDQAAVQSMLQKQRDSVSGVSLDEEMTNLLQFQHAYEASAKLVATLDSMLATVISMKV